MIGATVGVGWRKEHFWGPGWPLLGPQVPLEGPLEGSFGPPFLRSSVPLYVYRSCVADRPTLRVALFPVPEVPGAPGGLRRSPRSPPEERARRAQKARSLKPSPGLLRSPFGV